MSFVLIRQFAWMDSHAVGEQKQNYSGSFIQDRAAAELHILCAKCCCSQEHNQLCTEWTDHQELLLHTELHFLLHNLYLCCLLLLFSLSALRPLQFLFIIKTCFYWEKLKRYCTHNQQKCKNTDVLKLLMYFCCSFRFDVHFSLMTTLC